MSDKVLKLEQAADELGVSKYTVRRLIAQGRLASLQVNESEQRRHLRVPTHCLDALIDVEPVAAKSLPSKDVADLRIPRFMRGAS